MQHDDVIWQVIDQGFCSFKAKTRTATFCRNEENVTGLCNRMSCPLANSRYATIKEEEGEMFLYMKTIERAHMPNRLWERIKLSRDYTRALQTLDEQLEYWPKFMIHRCKQRLTKIHQYLIRMRKLHLKVAPKLVPIHKKIERREEHREQKALKAAKISEAIKNELLQRLQQGTYGDIYNFPIKEYQQVLDAEEQVEEEAEQDDDEQEFDDEEMSEFVEAYDDEVMSDDDVEDCALSYDDADFDESLDARFEEKSNNLPLIPPRRPKQRRAFVEIEYENESETTPNIQQTSSN